MIGTLPDGAIVRVRANRCGVERGVTGVVAYTHPDSGNPVVVVGSGGSRRPVAFTLDELEVITMPAQPEIATALDVAASRPAGYSWRVFDPRQMVITLSPTTIRLSAAAAERMATVERVEIKYDRSRGAIALVAAANSRRSFKVAHTKSGAVISARAFLDLINFADGKTFQYTATWSADDGGLVITGVPFRRDGNRGG